MESISIHEATTHLSRLVERAEAGEEIIICRGDEPVAKLVGCTPQTPPRGRGRLKGQNWMADDFDEPLEEFADYM